MSDMEGRTNVGHGRKAAQMPDMEGRKAAQDMEGRKAAHSIDIWLRHAHRQRYRHVA